MSCRREVLARLPLAVIDFDKDYARLACVTVDGKLAVAVMWKLLNILFLGPFVCCQSFWPTRDVDDLDKGCKSTMIMPVFFFFLFLQKGYRFPD